jgi:hypothetical protein
MPPLEGDEDDASRMEEVDWIVKKNKLKEEDHTCRITVTTV